MKYKYSKTLLALLLIPALGSADVKLEKLGSFGEIFKDAKFSGDYAYASTSSGLVVLDVSNLGKPTFVTKLETTGNNSLDMIGNYLVVTNRNSLQIIDVSTPASPQIVQTLSAIGWISDIKIVDTYAYIAIEGAGKGLFIYDLTDPLSPVTKGQLNTGDTTKAVAINGQKAYVADKNNGLSIVDISDKENPTLLGTYNFENSGATSVDIDGNFAYIGTLSKGQMKIDVTDPENPTLVSRIHQGIGSNTDLMKSDDYIISSHYNGVQIVDFESDAENPELVGNLAAATNADYLKVGPIRDSFFYAAGEASGLNILDYSYYLDDNTTNDHIGIGSTYSTIGLPTKVAVKGNYAYVSDQEGGLQVLDVSDLSKPTHIGGIDLGFCATTSVALDESRDYAYVTDKICKGFYAIDISDPANPILDQNASVVTPNEANDVTIKGNYAYVADKLSGLQIIDITDPLNPTPVGSYDTNGIALAVEVQGNYAYIADQNETLQIVNISDPATPTLQGSYDTNLSGFAHDLKVDGNYTYIANYAIGLQIVDTSDPSNPVLKGIYDHDTNTSEDNAESVDVKGNYAYVAYRNKGLKVIDISDPENPTLAKEQDTEGIASSVTISGDNIFVSNRGAGIEIFSTEPLTPLQSFVARLYTNIMDRLYDQNGLDFWTGEFGTGRTATDIAKYFFTSEEFNEQNLPTSDFVTRAYKTLFNRDPSEDQDGFNYWVNEIEQNGKSKKVVFFNLAFSDEFKTVCENYGVTNYNSADQLEAFVERMYVLVLGRDSDPQGLGEWKADLQSGAKTASNIVHGFFSSTEFADMNVDNTNFVKIAYRSIMGREGEGDGLDYWVGEINGDMTREQLIDSFLATPEFEQIMSDYGISSN